MRADRLLSIMLLLQVRQRVTAGELAERLEVSPRTIHRDMEALSAAGIPVAAERGIGGGWFLLDGYETNLTGLNEAEIKTLFLSQPDRLLGDLGLRQAAEAALIKLLAALPTMYRRDAEFVRQRIHVDATGWRRYEEDISCLPTLQEAIWQERKLSMIYQRSDRTAVERLVDPLGLVAKGNVWYLVAAVEGEVRTYRVSRVQEARMTEQRCTRPPGFDLAAHWEESKARFVAGLPRYPATVRVAPAVLPRLRSRWRYARIEQEDPPDAEGWVKLSVQFETEEEAYAYVLSCGPQVEVLEPPALREQVISLAERIVALYA